MLEFSWELLEIARQFQGGSLTWAQALAAAKAAGNSERWLRAAVTAVRAGLTPAAAVVEAAPVVEGIGAAVAGGEVAAAGTTIGGIALAPFLAAAVGTALVIGAIYYASQPDRAAVDFGAKKPAIEDMLRLDPAERETLRKVEKPAVVRTADGEPYAIWLVGDRKEVIVGRKSEIEEQPSSSLVGWGLESTKVKEWGRTWEKVGGKDYRTAEEALGAYESMKGGIRYLPLGLGTAARFEFDGVVHVINNATRFLR